MSGGEIGTTRPRRVFDRDGLGSSKAGVAVIEYSDFKCPYCGVFARDAWPDLKSKYVDAVKVRFVFRQLPVDQLHPFARTAA